MATMTEVAERVNFDMFKRCEMGACVRVGGRLAMSAEQSTQLTTTDGGVLALADLLDVVPGFVEVIGKKAGDNAMAVVGVTPLGESVDVELWNEAVKMTSLPLLQSYFKPA
mmetsp:Transcript_24815/g.39843  ORF Transcript_24815/g.39843 Transcript_24815/m.39843 type:complete len:111 (+) Transcript_24815:77-409(+)